MDGDADGAEREGVGGVGVGEGVAVADRVAEEFSAAAAQRHGLQLLELGSRTAHHKSREKDNDRRN